MRADVHDEGKCLLRVLCRSAAISECRRALQVVGLPIEVLVSLRTLSPRLIQPPHDDAVRARAVEVTALHATRLRHVAQLLELAMQHGRGVLRTGSEERVDLGPSAKCELHTTFLVGLVLCDGSNAELRPALIVLVIRRQLRVTRQRRVDDDRRLIRQKPLSDTKQATRSESIHCGILVLRSSMR